MAKAIFIDGHLLVPVVILFVFMGSWLGAKSMGDLILMLSMGALGLFMKRSGWPRPPLIIALVLGPNMENALVISNRIYGTLGWLERTPSIIIGIIIVLTLVATALGVVRTRRDTPMPNTALDGKLSIEGGERNALVSLPLAIFFVVFFAAAAVIAVDYHPTNRQYPIAVSVAALLLLALILRKDLAAARSDIAEHGGLSRAWAAAVEKAQLYLGMRFVTWIATTVFGCWLIGQKFAIAGFILLYLLVWGKRPPWLAAVYAVGAYVFITLFYDRLMHIPFQIPFVQKLWESVT